MMVKFQGYDDEKSKGYDDKNQRFDGKNTRLWRWKVETKMMKSRMYYGYLIYSRNYFCCRYGVVDFNLVVRNLNGMVSQNGTLIMNIGFILHYLGHFHINILLYNNDIR
jgi:hypothetical protein